MNIMPDPNDLWLGIAGHFDSLTQILCEFIDNSISNIEANQCKNRSIYININEQGDDLIQISVEDAGTGIKILNNSLKIGDKQVREGPLNEHGFGLKHALASANPENDNWKIFTRTKEDFENNIYKLIEAPYSFDINIQEISTTNQKWEGEFNSSGTIVIFTCSRTMFNTLQRGIRGQAGFDRCLDYLCEELGYTYAGVIEKGKATLTIASSDKNYNKTIESIKPEWLGFYKPESGSLDYNLGGGELKIEYVFGEMDESDYFKHYKRNMSTSGVEIRINGRLLMKNLFKEIWGTENHPTFNHFLAIINLVTNNSNALPKTRTSKNGIRAGDEKLEKLFTWIRNTHPSPHKELSGAVSETELVKELATFKENHIRNDAKHIEANFEVFKNLNSPVKVDLYVFDGNSVLLYEAKKDTADLQSLYQLIMYWDGAVADGLTPTEGILIASSFSPGIDEMIKYFIEKTDSKGNQYKITKKTWKEENIQYPD